MVNINKIFGINVFSEKCYYMFKYLKKFNIKITKLKWNCKEKQQYNGRQRRQHTNLIELIGMRAKSKNKLNYKILNDSKLYISKYT